MVAWLAANWLEVLEKGLLVVGAASAFVKVVGSLNEKWTWDNKLTKALDWLLALAGRVALNPKQP